MKTSMNTWKGNKIFSINYTKDNDTPSLSTKQEKYINDPISFGNMFNNFFTSVTQKSNFQINHSGISCH